MNLKQRIEKQPQWVRRYIGKLEHDNASLHAERGQIADGNARITFRVRFDEVHGIPDRATVRFKLQDGYIEFSLRNDEVWVRGCGHQLVIKPSAANAVNLSVQRLMRRTR